MSSGLVFSGSHTTSSVLLGISATLQVYKEKAVVAQWLDCSIMGLTLLTATSSVLAQG